MGLGPVGAALANLLGAMGIATIVVERWPTHYSMPRAVHFDDEAMRLLQTIGIADEMAPDLIVNKGMRFVTKSGELLIDWPRPQQLGPLGWYPSYRFYQPQLEMALRRKLGEYPGVSVIYQAEVTDVTAHDAGVTLQWHDIASQTQGTIECEFVVGCDGARSQMRDWIGGGMEDLGCDQDWLVVDVVANRPLEHLSDWTLQYCDPARPTTTARGPGLRRRWEFMVMPGDDRATLTEPAQVWRLLERWITPADAVIERAAVYQFHALLAHDWRAGRLLIAGDAAHQTPPFLGQGLCAGLRDAVNLAWKLAAVVRGHAAPALLDTYQSERKPHARAFLHEALRLGAVLQATDAEAEARQGTMARAPVRMASIRPLLGPGLHGDAPAPAGAIFPQPVLSDGRRFDDAVGINFALYAGAEWLQSLPDSLNALLAKAGIVVVAVPDDDNILLELDARAVVVRPDRAILGVAKDARRLLELVALIG